MIYTGLNVYHALLWDKAADIRGEPAAAEFAKTLAILAKLSSRS
jgi:hypothetical protein